MPTVRVNDFNLYYEEAGNGPPLVLLHGLGACVEDWEYQIPEFAKHYRVIACDLRGFGRSERGTKALSVPCFAQDVWTFLQQLGVQDFFLMGHSMGGAAALQLALDHPAAVRKLVIVNSVPTFRPRTLGQHFEIWYRLLVMGLLGPARLAHIGAQRMFPHRPDLQAKAIRRSIAYNTRASYIGALRALTRWSVVERLGELKMPTLVLAAEHDYFTHADSVQFAHALPKGRLHSFPGTHHGLPMEAPEEFNKVVLKFLRAH